jgi:hypothetical protein
MSYTCEPLSVLASPGRKARLRASPPTLSMLPRSSVNPLEDCWDPENNHNFQSLGGALEQSNKHSEIVFIDCSLSLIG